MSSIDLNNFYYTPLLKKSFFTFNEYIPEDENEFFEYKDYKPPIYCNQEKMKTLKRTINAFINTKGGVIFIGITDDKLVRGILLNDKEKDITCNFLFNLVNSFYPSCNFNSVQVKLIEVYNERRTCIINSLYVIKIIILQGDVRMLYSVDNTFSIRSFLRYNSQNIALRASQVYEEIIKRQVKQERIITKEELLSYEQEVSMKYIKEPIKLNENGNKNGKDNENIDFSLEKWDESIGNNDENLSSFVLCSDKLIFELELDERKYIDNKKLMKSFLKKKEKINGNNIIHIDLS